MDTRNTEMNKRKFLSLFGLGILASLFSFRSIRKKNQPETGKIKMLTPDGKLVLVDKSKLKSGKENARVTNNELRSWMDQKNI